MTTRWIRQGTPGHVVVTGTAGIFLTVDVYDSTGTKTHTDRLNRDRKHDGPKGYVPADTLPAQPAKPRTHHNWGRPVRVDGERWGQRCGCGLERQELGAGGRYLFRRKGGEWTASERTPAYETP